MQWISQTDTIDVLPRVFRFNVFVGGGGAETHARRLKAARWRLVGDLGCFLANVAEFWSHQASMCFPCGGIVFHQACACSCILFLSIMLITLIPYWEQNPIKGVFSCVEELRQRWAEEGDVAVIDRWLIVVSHRMTDYFPSAYAHLLFCFVYPTWV